ncbi:protein UXT-like [Mya arenaria]|uniref:protein UXT-like n=1 Tax=Mya arenaria TaxID=6604 RepID=UPI0022DF086F|nr:protein UXT-like [Mya arenaria]
MASIGVEKKVEEYERFVNEKLREDLRKIIEQRDQVYSQIAEYLQLKNTIEQIKKAGVTEDLKTKVDLGCNFYVQANIADPRTIFVFVGYGFFVEMSFDEAIKFIDKRTKFLNDHTDHLTSEANKVKANIRLVIEGLRELQNIQSADEETNKKDLFL